MNETTDSLIAALNAADITSDNHLFIRRLMDTIGISGYVTKNAQSEAYVLAARRDGLPDLRIYWGYTTGFTTEEEAALLGAALGTESGKSGKLKGKWYVGHPVNGGLGPRGRNASTKKREPDKCPRCRVYTLSVTGICPGCDDE